MRGLNLKKVITTAMLVFGFMMLVPTTVEAKTKSLNFNINKTSANDFCEKIQSKGKEEFFNGNKNKYKIVIQVKASSVKDGRAKVKKFAKKVMTADSNKYGLSYGVQMDDYNTEKYDSKKKLYTTKLNNSVNDIYYLNAITSRALRDVDFWQEHWVDNIIAVFPNNESFKKLSQSAKTEFILKYLGNSCMTWDDDYKYTPITWEKLYKKEQKGVCSDHMNMYWAAIRLVAFDYEMKDEVNYKANHGCVLAKVKNSKGDYDYFEGNNGGFGAYNYLNTANIKSCKADKQVGTMLGDWQVKDAKNYKVTKLEKAAYKYCTATKKSDLEEMGIY